MALPLFAVTLFVSAFQLFLVQPMIGQMILPKLGGTPQVWNTCMVFFQSALLAGYAYTHSLSTTVSVRRQILIHGLLLFLPLAILLPQGPFHLMELEPTPGANPIGKTLLYLAVIVGLPFFVVATSAPLLQKWFGATGHPAAKDPYFLYGASNLGSMLALLAYPVLVEPWIGLRAQAEVWLYGYFALIFLYFVCAVMVWKSPASLELAQVPAGALPPPQTAAQSSEAITGSPTAPAGTLKPVSPITAKPGKRPKGGAKAVPAAAELPSGKWVEPPPSDDLSNWRRLRWVLLAAVPSSLMLGVSSYISTDISAMPLFWILPLALYLLSFILVFLRWPVPWTHGPHSFMVLIHPIFVLVLAWILMTRQVSPIERSISLSLLGFFLTALVCHGELARDRPGTARLTEFYLWLAVGGMVGGMFNSLFAPLLFVGIVEYPLALVLGCLLRPLNRHLAPISKPMASGLGAVFGALLVLSLLSWSIASVFSWGFLFFLAGGGAGALIGFFYQPSSQENSWTDDFIAKTFPGLAEWARQTGQDLAKSFGRTVKGGSVYVLSLGLDVLLGLFIALLVLVLVTNLTIRGFLIKGTGQLLELIGLTVDQERRGIIGTAITYGIPMIFCFFFAARPLRFGLAFGAVLLVTGFISTRDDKVLEAVRSYFGSLRVYENTEYLDEEGTIINTVHTYLLHGTTHHGLNFRYPEKMNRVATTYYHQLGPAGIVMEKFNWFKDFPKYGYPGLIDDQGRFFMHWLNKELKDLNQLQGKPGGVGVVEMMNRALPVHTYNTDFRFSDTRMPAYLAAVGAGPNSFGLAGPLPVAQLAGLWSEPPYATIGLGTGTMASYGRPYQHVHFYEIDNHIRRFSLQDKPHFSYLRQAQKRGSLVQVLMGDARLRMQQKYQQHDEKAEERGQGVGGGPDNFYHMMVVDAFSSDAIPRHLITKQALEMYFTKLAPHGILCVHTSNKFVDLVPVVANAARHAEFDEVAPATGKREKKKGLACRVGHDNSPFWYTVHKHNLPGYRHGREGPNGGHYTSEWVMVARTWEDLKGKGDPKGWKGLQAPDGYIEAQKAGFRNQLRRQHPDADPTAIDKAVDNAVERGAFEPYWRDLTFDESGQLIADKEVLQENPGRPWTDDFSNVFGALRRHR